MISKPRARTFRATCLLGLGVLCAAYVGAQQTSAPAAPEPAPPPPGKVLFSTEHPPAGAASTNSSSSQEAPVESGPPDVRPTVPVTNAERTSIAITGYRLDLHLIPARGREELRAELTVRNVSAAPVARVPLQISSTLRWQTVSTLTPGGLAPVPFTQSPIATDTDHTGYAEEAVLTPPVPLAPGKETTFAVFFSGPIPQSADRLTLIGAPQEKADATDWDAIVPETDTSATALRGFGDVLWYPVAEPIALFGDRNKLFELIRQVRLRDASTSIALRLTVEYLGDPPDAVLFDTHLQPLVKAPDTEDSLVTETRGTATASFPAQPIGFRTPSLFLTGQRAVVTEGQLLSVITADPDAIAPYAEAAAHVSAELTAWLGAGPTSPLQLLDHVGEPFEDETLLVGRLNPQARPEAIAPELVRGLAHAWFNPQAPQSLWLGSGVAELMALLATENLLGREAAVKELQQAYVLLALSEPAPAGTASPPSSATPSASSASAASTSSSSAPAALQPPRTQTGAATETRESFAPQPLTAAYSETYVRFKSLSVLWQLREQLGEEVMRNVLTRYRHNLLMDPELDKDPRSFQLSLEHTVGRDFSWFFSDWVYNDRGLPDLTIVAANARPLPARAGLSDGYLVAVEVRNDGGAVADVPVTVRNSDLTASERLRIPAHSVAAVRIVFTGDPQEVEVNDGSVPEAGALIHTAQVHAAAAP